MHLRLCPANVGCLGSCSLKHPRSGANHLAPFENFLCKVSRRRQPRVVRQSGGNAESPDASAFGSITWQMRQLFLELRCDFTRLGPTVSLCRRCTLWRGKFATIRKTQPPRREDLAQVLRRVRYKNIRPQSRRDWGRLGAAKMGGLPHAAVSNVQGVTHRPGLRFRAAGMLGFHQRRL
jgi:hypothetical protein